MAFTKNFVNFFLPKQLQYKDLYNTINYSERFLLGKCKFKFFSYNLRETD